MRYSGIDKTDIANGEGVGVALFVQGCPFHCKGCFNPETWDFKGGKEFTAKTKEDLIKLIQRPYITRITILGGEPLCPQNAYEIYLLIKELRQYNKKIWLYTGNTYEDLYERGTYGDNPYDVDMLSAAMLVDVLVDGQFVEEKKDLTLKFRGSSNQRVIDIARMRHMNCLDKVIIKEGY